MPVYLFADSQLLFWSREGISFTESIRDLVRWPDPKAAYIGASNSDNPDYYSIFLAAMEGAGIRDCRQIPSALSHDDRSFINKSDLILLAGGDVKLGWNVMSRNGLKDLLVERYLDRALLAGISAGAVHLGLYGYSEHDDEICAPFETLGLVPFVIGAHEEKEDWKGLEAAIRQLSGTVRGIGIPSGGGLIYRLSDNSIESIRHPAMEISAQGDELAHNLLLPLTALKDDTPDKEIRPVN